MASKLRRDEETFTRTWRKAKDFAGELPHCGWKLLGILVAVGVVVLCVGSTICTATVYLWGGKSITMDIPEMVQKTKTDLDF